MKLDRLTGVLAALAIVVTGAVGAERVLRPRFPPLPPRLDSGLVSLLADGGHRVGPDDARVTMIVYYSYTCGFSHQFQTTLAALRARYPRELAIVFKPLAGGTLSTDEPYLAMECGAAQRAFAETHEALFRESARPSLATPARWRTLASTSGVPDPAAFEHCVLTKQFASKLDEQLSIAGDLGITGTPTSLINGRVMVGLHALEALDRIVRHELGL